MASERTARVLRVVDHGPDTRSIFLAPDAPVPFEPGAFISVLVPTAAAPINRAYSIASDPETADGLELLFDRVPGGPGSTFLFTRQPGDPVTFTGPWGAFTLDRAPDAECVFLAIDTGIAPIRPMIRRCLATTTRPTHLHYATGHAAYHRELKALAGLDLMMTTPPALVDEVTRRWITADDDRTRHFFICGVGDGVHALRDALRAAGYARRAVRYERW